MSESKKTGVNSFGFGETKDDVVRVWVRTRNYDDFKEWMPFITWSGSFAESLPMQTSFTIPENRKADVTGIMAEHGYIQK